MAEGTLKEELSDWLDKLAIQELIVRYSDIATRGLWEEFERLWTADAVWETAPPINDRTVGANAIRAQVAKNLAGEEFLVQTTHGSVVTLHGGDRASATTTIHAIARTGRRPRGHQLRNLFRRAGENRGWVEVRPAAFAAHLRRTRHASRHGDDLTTGARDASVELRSGDALGDAGITSFPSRTDSRRTASRRAEALPVPSVV